MTQVLSISFLHHSLGCCKHLRGEAGSQPCPVCRRKAGDKRSRRKRARCLRGSVSDGARTTFADIKCKARTRPTAKKARKCSLAGRLGAHLQSHYSGGRRRCVWWTISRGTCHSRPQVTRSRWLEAWLVGDARSLCSRHSGHRAMSFAPASCRGEDLGVPLAVSAHFSARCSQWSDPASAPLLSFILGWRWL